MLRELRKRGLPTPAIILSNSSHPLNVAEAAELGVREYLVKADWEIDEVVEKILSHLKKP
jgi:DNA-binding NarL/FixJ family response regulator